MPVRSLVEIFYGQLWNRVDLAVTSVILHPDVSFRGSVGLAAVGRAEVCDYVTMVTTALSDYRGDVEALIVQRAERRCQSPVLGAPPRRLPRVPANWPAGRVDGAAFFVAEEDMLRDIWVLGDLANLWTQLDRAD